MAKKPPTRTTRKADAAAILRHQFKKPLLSVDRMKALLEDPAFKEACDQLFTATSGRGPTKQEIEEFFQVWGVLPPRNIGIFNPRGRPGAGAILSGQWGLIPVFPWTTQGDVLGAFVKLQDALPREHRDAARREHGHNARPRLDVAEWLRSNGVPAGRYLYADKIDRDIQADAQELQREARGYHKGEAESSRRGYETAAEDTARRVVARYDAEQLAEQRAIKAPRNCDELSYAVTLLLHAAYLPTPDKPNITQSIARLGTKLLHPGQS
jgi:hypothetical protein